MTKTEAGIFLLSEPFLKDPNFTRSVILLCEHDKSGSFGFVLNKKAPLKLQDVLEGVENSDIELFEGGPVGSNSLHFIHNRGDLIEGGQEIAENIFWGGDFSTVLDLIQLDLLSLQEIRFFVGYSGWTKNQLQEELDEKTWITTKAKSQFVFGHSDNLWKDILKDMGGEYTQLINYPLDPQLN